MQLSILIVEDELSYSIELERLCEKVGYQVVGVAESSSEALDLVYSKQPDLLLMDVDIKGRMSGIEVGKSIKHLRTPILYLTSHGDERHRRAAEETNMIGYVVKPIREDNLRTVLSMAVYSTYFRGGGDELSMVPDMGDQGVIFFKKKKLYRKVHVADIAFISSEGNYCKVVIGKGEEQYLLRTTISALHDLLPKREFSVIHRSHIVRNALIEAVSLTDRTVLVNGQDLPVSRNKLGEIRKLFPFVN